jgi:hypothetical protein
VTFSYRGYVYNRCFLLCYECNTILLRVHDMLYSSHFRVTDIALYIYQDGLGDFWKNCDTFITVTFIARFLVVFGGFW